MRFEKRPLTIMELLISMTLALFLMTTLTYFYSQITKISREMDRLQKISFEKRYLENRLSHILPRSLKHTSKDNDFLFMSVTDQAGLFKPGTSSLLFSFDNCVKFNKNFAYHVIGQLFVDPKGRLILAIWPVKKRWNGDEPPPIHKEILYEGVEGLTFSFYIPPEIGAAKRPYKEMLTKLPPDFRGQWVDQWLPEYGQLPAIVKMTITLKKGDDEEVIDYAFPLPHTPLPIIYGG